MLNREYLATLSENEVSVLVLKKKSEISLKLSCIDLNLEDKEELMLYEYECWLDQEYVCETVPNGESAEEK